ncbi:MAG TPA: hypothetical protein VGW74_06885 [Propionibacteriaceae bacterium]|nr:hypothetical protein [Propionibacteriaceae bacterium]
MSAWEAALLAGYVGVPVVAFGGMCINDYRRRGPEAFRWLHEPELAIGLLALPAWPILVPLMLGVEGWERLTFWASDQWVLHKARRRGWLARLGDDGEWTVYDRGGQPVAPGGHLTQTWAIECALRRERATRRPAGRRG